MAGSTIIAVEVTSLTILLVGIWLCAAVAFLRRIRPQLMIGRQIAVGYALRLLVIPALAFTGLGGSLRGGDENIFLAQAKTLAMEPFTSGQWLPWNHQSFLHVILFAFQIKLLGSPEGAIRVAQVGIALTGALMILAAVYDLGGARPSRFTAWLLALEPASLFFNELIHKDPLMELASGCVILGATKVWQRFSAGGVALMVLGGLIALTTRYYVGYFLFACTAILILHTWIRRLSVEYRMLPALLGVVSVFAVGAPVLLASTSSQNLHVLAHSQATNTSPTYTGQADSDNLALESVDFSSRSGLITGLPLRIRDLLVRPYPWQIADLSQSIGVLGSLVALSCLYLLIRYAWISRGELFECTGPLLYPLIFLTIAYALAVGNAGTGFRYRTHLVTIALAVMALLREKVLQRRADQAESLALMAPVSVRSSEPDTPTRTLSLR